MGSKNPLKQVFKATGDLVTNPLRETARAIGADGVVDALDKGKDFYNGINNSLIDKASGKEKRLAQEAEAAGERKAGMARSAAAAETSRKAAAANAAVEAERMSGGSASRTLLTGPAGLEDEEESISRKTLMGF